MLPKDYSQGKKYFFTFCDCESFSKSAFKDYEDNQDYASPQGNPFDSEWSTLEVRDSD